MIFAFQNDLFPVRAVASYFWLGNPFVERVDPQKVLQTAIFAFQNRLFLVRAVASHFWRGNPLSGWTPGK